MKLNDLEGHYVETDFLPLSDLQTLMDRYHQYLEVTPVTDPRRGFVEDWTEDLQTEIAHRNQEKS